MGARDLIDEAEAEAEVRRIWARHAVPAPLESVAEWADKTPRQIAKGPEKGAWRTARTPYLREPMECASEGSGIEKVVMQFATQIGKTEVLYNTILQRIHRTPIDMMVVQPTLTDAKDHSRNRFMPTVRRMPDIAERLGKPSSRDESASWQTKTISGGATLYFAGANSARSLASKPLALVAADEIDGWPHDVDGEGDPLGIVIERTSNFPDRKIILCSTPTLRDFSRIEAEYLLSDRRRYWVPCAHCQQYQVLEWGSDKDWGIKWLKTPAGDPRPETTVYICRACGGAMEERHKTEMLAAGQWRAEAPGAQMGLVAGFQLSKLYSPVGWQSWRGMAGKWLAAQVAKRAGDTSSLKTFINTNLAETYEESGDRADESELLKRAADIPLRVVTWGLYVATIGVDVQGDRIEAYVWAWGRGMEQQLVDRAVFYGDPAIEESQIGSPWAALTEYRRTPILHASGRPVPVLACMVDSGGHHTQAVYAYARAHQHAHVHAVKGMSQAGKALLGKPTPQDVTWRGQKMKGGVKLWPIGTDGAKFEIYGRLRTAQPGPGYVHLSRHLAPEVFDQLTSEKLVTRYVKGRPRLEWVKPAGRRNEALDCAVYALAAAHFAGIDRWREGDWRKWQARVEDRSLFDEPVAPPPPPPAALTQEPPPAAAEPAHQAEPSTPPAQAQTPPQAAPPRRPVHRPTLPQGRRRW